MAPYFLFFVREKHQDRKGRKGREEKQRIIYSRSARVVGSAPFASYPDKIFLLIGPQRTQRMQRMAMSRCVAFLADWLLVSFAIFASFADKLLLQPTNHGFTEAPHVG